jgi:hypothetical protein
LTITKSIQLPVPAPKKSPARITMLRSAPRSANARSSLSICTRMRPLGVVGCCGVRSLNTLGMPAPKL